jgi:uncharacterized repeat protein (TIGR03803 family)
MTTTAGVVPALLVAAAAMPAIGTPAHAQTYNILHRFQGSPDGELPFYGHLVWDQAGYLYGTASAGGASGRGAVFKVDASGETVLYSFAGTPDGETPFGGLFRDSTGILYGTTTGGGVPGSYGTVFKLDTDGTETVLYRFKGGADGANPYAGVTRDEAGNLYGTTYSGGAANGGVVFKLDPAGNETVLHSFTGAPDGQDPYAGVILDASGNLYGVTYGGGAAGWGVAFKLDPDGNETLLHTFTGGADGGLPSSGLILDSSDNLYGTAGSGGTTGWGVVFKLDPSGAETVLYTFMGQPDGGEPLACLLRDAAGNLYGTTNTGGATNHGAVFELDAAGHETVLHSFTGGEGGAYPYDGLIEDQAGNLYGTALKGGSGTGPSGHGVVFQLEP